MDAVDYLRAQVELTKGYQLVVSAGMDDDALKTCEEEIGARLADSVRVVLGRCNGFDLRDEGGSVLRMYSTKDIVAWTLEMRRIWGDGGRWGNFIGIARSDESESAYAIRPTSRQEPESPLFEIWPDGWDQWQKNKPIAQSFDAWLREIGDAIATGDHEQVYAKLWLDPSQDI